MGGCTGAIISNEDGVKLLRVFEKLMTREEPFLRRGGFNIELMPRIVSSGIEGIGTILSLHISSDEFIDAFTDGDVKTGSLYLGITKVDANSRFTWANTRGLMKRLYNE
jgi:hypothetical protein